MAEQRTITLTLDPETYNPKIRAYNHDGVGGRSVVCMDGLQKYFTLPRKLPSEIDVVFCSHPGKNRVRLDLRDRRDLYVRTDCRSAFKYELTTVSADRIIRRMAKRGLKYVEIRY